MYVSVLGPWRFLHPHLLGVRLAGYPSANSAVASAQGDPANFLLHPVHPVRRPLGSPRS